MEMMKFAAEILIVLLIASPCLVSGYCDYDYDCSYSYSTWWIWVVVVAIIVKASLFGCWCHRRRQNRANLAYRTMVNPPGVLVPGTNMGYLPHSGANMPYAPAPGTHMPYAQAPGTNLAYAPAPGSQMAYGPAPGTNMPYAPAPGSHMPFAPVTGSKMPTSAPSMPPHYNAATMPTSSTNVSAPNTAATETDMDPSFPVPPPYSSSAGPSGPGIVHDEAKLVNGE